MMRWLMKGKEAARYQQRAGSLLRAGLAALPSWRWQGKACKVINMGVNPGR